VAVPVCDRARSKTIFPTLPGVRQLHPDGLAGARPVDQSRGSLNWGPSEKNACIAIGAGYRNLNTHFSSPSAAEL
jgi:hypothetical protein